MQISHLVGVVLFLMNCTCVLGLFDQRNHMYSQELASLGRGYFELEQQTWERSECITIITSCS